jgi:hypothetical protein
VQNQKAAPITEIEIGVNDVLRWFFAVVNNVLKNGSLDNNNIIFFIHETMDFR